MTNSPSDIVQVARSSETYDDLPVIDLTVFEENDGVEILEGHKDSLNETEENNKTSFQPISLRKKNAIIASILIIALVFAVTYSEQFFRSSAFAHGASVGGVNLGGKSNSQAKKALTARADIAIDTPLLFKLGNEKTSISSQDIGLEYDIDASLKSAKKIGTSSNPLVAVPNLFARYLFGENIDPVVKYDKAKFETVVNNLVDTFSKGRANAGVEIEDTKVKVISPKSGQGVSYEQASKALKDTISDFSHKETTLKSEKVNAQITLAEAERTASILRTMFSRPTTITTPAGNSVSISPDQLSAAIVIKPDKSSLKISIDEKKIREELSSQLQTVESAPVDATFATSATGVSVVPSIPGKQIDFTSALKKWVKGEHSFVAEVVDVQPAHDTKWASSLNITEVVSSFSTNFTAGQTRVKNIRRAAEQVNNTVIEPGETFSLNAALGKRTAENGYFKAPVYSDADGFFEDYGGGASQFSTTLFNAAFIGGYKDVTHTPHTIYISRYPKGREATLNWGSIDMAFKNDSNSGILIRTGLGTSSLSVTLYGNKEGRKVTLEGPVELGQTPIGTEYTDDPTLNVGVEKETQHGYPGIVVENYRTVDRPGKPGRKERYRWTYNMVPRKVIRGTKPV